MVSHLTADILNGKEVTFKQFMSKCAMDIDFNKRSREVTFISELPVYEPNIQYYERQLDNAKQSLKDIKAKTDEELEAYLLEQYEVGKQLYEKTKAEKEAMKVPLVDMLHGVRAWTPPTVEHEFLKGYAIGSLERAIESDCRVYTPEPVLQDKDEYRQMCIEMYERDIVTAQERIDKEIESCKKSNEWNKALIDSIDAMMMQEEV